MTLEAQTTKSKKTRTDNPRTPVVSAEKVRVLYVGLDNELAIMADCRDGDQMTITTDNGKITKSENGIYIARPENIGMAKVFVDVNGRKHEYLFRSKHVPDPVAKVGTSTGGRIPSSYFKAQKELYADLENFLFEGVEFNIVGYTFYATDSTAFKDATAVRMVSNVGGSFEPIKDLIDKCTPGTTIVFDQITAQGPDKMYRKLSTIAFNLY